MGRGSRKTKGALVQRSQKTPGGEDIAPWMNGQCAAYAVAFQEKHPELGFAIEYWPMSESDARSECAESGEEWDGTTIWEAQHVYACSRELAYDAEGSHPIPFEKEEGVIVEYDLSYDDIKYSGLLEYGYVESATEFIEEFQMDLN